MQITHSLRTLPLYRPQASSTASATTEPNAEPPTDSVTFDDRYPYTGTTHLLKMLGAASAITFLGGLGGLAVGLISGNGALAGKSAAVTVASAFVGMATTSQFE